MEDRTGIASAGLAHAIAQLSDSQQVCIVTDSAGETLSTVAGLIRAADLGRDRFAILTSAPLAGALPEVLAHAGIELPAAIASGMISVSSGAHALAEPEALVGLLRGEIDALSRPFNRRFAILDVGQLCGCSDPQVVLTLQVALGKAAADLGVIVLSLYDRSTLPPGIVHDAVFSHRLVLAHGVLGENLHFVPPSALITSRETSLDVDELLRTLEGRPPRGTAGDLPMGDAASRRLSEANELLQREIAQRVRMEHVLSASEERYRLLVEALPDCVFVHSAGAIVFVNRAGVEMVRGAGPESILGKSVMSFVHPESLPTVSARVRMMTQQGLRAPMMVERFLRLDGSDFYAEAVAAPLVFEGKPAIQVVMRDITDRKRAEAQERHLSEQLQRAQKMEAIGTLASGIAHDFNNILTGILGYAELILMQTREGEIFHKAATVIGTAAERGAGLARKILMVARKEKIERQTVDLNLLVQSAADLLRKGLPGNIELVLNLRERLPLLEADPDQIDQVVMNLATNARDAMPDGGRLTIETGIAEPSELENAQTETGRDGWLRLSVTDTGVGMDEETQRRVYDPFFTTKKMGRGTGLGLYIVHGAVSNHGGRIRLSSEPGRGTRISVYLPVVRGEAAGEAQAPTDPRGGGTILVIDDESAVREMCKDLLAPLGYTVLTAADGEEGVRVFRASPDSIHVVLLDMVMPKLDGRQVFEELRKIRPGVRVILCSGYSQSGYEGIQTLISAGARGFVQKPFTLRAISAAIKEALEETGPPPDPAGSAAVP